MTVSVRLALAVGASLVGLLAFGAGPALAAYTAQVQGSTLEVVGNGASDKLALRLQSGVPTMLEVDVGDDGTADFTFDRTTFTGISVQAGSGNDQVRVDQANGPFTDEALSIDGGKGNDTLLGGDGADTLIGGSNDDTVDGNRGSDVAFLGSGDDTFHWDPGDGSDTVEGQTGTDTLDFSAANVSENIDVSANGQRVRFTRDVGAITMDLDGIEDIAVHVFGGTDHIVVDDLTGTAAKAVDVDLAASGGGGDSAADTVTVNGTSGPDQLSVSSSGGTVSVAGLQAVVGATGVEAGFDIVAAVGGAGDDTITTGVGVTGPAAITVDGGADTDTTQFEGTAADDSIQLTANGTAVSVTAPGTAVVNSTAEKLVVHGLGGADTTTASGALSTLTALTIDGGKGDDTLGGGNGADILIGGPGNDHVDGNQGLDVALLGTGNDTFHWDPGDGSDIVEGQAGNDTLDFSAANVGENMAVSANGRRVSFFRDVGNITMDLDGTETIAVHALGGADHIVVNDLTGTAAKAVTVDLAAFGGGGDSAADTVTVNGTSKPDKVKVTAVGSAVLTAGLRATTQITGSEPALDTLLLNTLAGDDTVSIGAGVTGLIQTTVDLGPDG